MKLFKSNTYLNSTRITENSISTPLGNIKFKFSLKSLDISKIPITDVYYLPNEGYILCWYSETLDAELMITPYKPALLEGMKVNGCYAVVWRVKGKNEEISCRFSSIWEEGYTWSEFGPESGEDLECQSWENSRIKVSLGTQDGEVLIARSNKNDLLPTTYDESIDPYSIVEYFDKGLTVPINNIRINEICQVHFIVAWAENIQYDTSTWFAVDALSSSLLAAGEVW